MTRQGSPSNMMAMPRRILVAVIGIAERPDGKRSAEHSPHWGARALESKRGARGMAPCERARQRYIVPGRRDAARWIGVLNEQMRVKLTRTSLLLLALGAGCRTAHSATTARPAAPQRDTLLPGMPPPLDPNNVYAGA